MARKDVCPDPNEKTVMQEPSKLGANREQSRYTPKDLDSVSYVGKVMELITDPYMKDARECQTIFMIYSKMCTSMGYLFPKKMIRWACIL